MGLGKFLMFSLSLQFRALGFDLNLRFNKKRASAELYTASYAPYLHHLVNFLLFLDLTNSPPKFLPANFGGGRIQPPFFFSQQLISLSERNYSTSTNSLIPSSLTDTRLLKRWLGTKPRRKRASLKPPVGLACEEFVALDVNYKQRLPILPKSESISQSSLQEVPLQSYGYWDGSRIQTGFSSLPEQAVMLAAYQGSSAGTPFYPAKDIGVASSSGVVSANRAAKNYQQAYSQPEMQKRSRFELVSGFQQGGRPALARLGINGGSRGVLVGSNGVSDPVAALKIAKLYTGEVESWTRDVNSR